MTKPRPVSIYVHVPFCKRRCPYCTFYHIPHIDEFEASFVDALVEEFVAATREIAEPIVSPTVFFGGGTPSVLGDSSLARIFDVLSAVIPNGAEITFETNPEDVTVESMRRLTRVGVNRLSLGVQSMSAGSLATLGRCRPRVNERAARIVGEHFRNFSMDVLVGTPGEGVGELDATLAFVTGQRPTHVSLYCLEPGGVMMDDVASFFDGVDAEDSAEHYLRACKHLSEAGYVHYEVSNFAIDGFACRHNRVYWTGGEYLGLGPGAHSFLAGRRFHNAPSIERYVTATGPFPTRVRVYDASGPAERGLERLMLALRTSDGLRLAGTGPAEHEVTHLVTSGLAVRAGDRLRLTDRGFLLLDEIVLRLGRATDPGHRPASVPDRDARLDSFPV